MVTVDQRENLLALMDFLQKKTDEDHPMTRAAILKKLKDDGYFMERKQFNSDLAILHKHGYGIVEVERKNGNAYYWGERLFETDELQLLADSVASSKYLTVERTQDMIGRLGTLTSEYKAAMLRKNICLTGHVKSRDESILLNVSVIHKAMNSGKKICFYYGILDVDKVRKRKKGDKYVVSPYRVIYTEDWYYLLGHSDDHDELRIYRLDRMEMVLVKNEERVIKEKYTDQYLNDNIKRMIHMFGGETEYVTFAFKRDSAEIFFNQFGLDVHITPHGDEFKGRVPVNVSPQFYGWLLGLDTKMRMIGPVKAVMSYRDYLIKHLEQLPGGRRFETKKVVKKLGKKKLRPLEREDADTPQDKNSKDDETAT